MEIPDTFENLDLDKLQRLLMMLSDSGVQRIQVGGFALSFSGATEEDKPLGFGPTQQKASTIESEVPTVDPYERAFRGRKPEFVKPKE